MYSKEDREDQIVEFVTKHGFARMSDVARALGLKKTPYLRDRFIHLVETGRLLCDEQLLSNKLRVFVFYPGVD